MRKSLRIAVVWFQWQGSHLFYFLTVLLHHDLSSTRSQPSTAMSACCTGSSLTLTTTQATRLSIVPSYGCRNSVMELGCEPGTWPSWLPSVLRCPYESPPSYDCVTRSLFCLRLIFPIYMRVFILTKQFTPSLRAFKVEDEVLFILASPSSSRARQEISIQ